MNKYLDVIGRYRDGRIIYYVREGTPMIGYIAFGVIDRGTNVLQVRPTTICPLNCIFCSVDAGPFSRHRWAEYIVDPKPIVETVEYAVGVKGYGLEALIDTIGDPLTYPWIVELVRDLKSVDGVSSVALETHGALLTYRLVDRLERAGLDRVNLSIETLDPVKARYLQGVQWYDVRRVMDVARYIVENTSIDLHVTPLWIPGVNDADVVDVVKWAIGVGAGKRWPPVTIQKYNVHHYGRRVRGVKPWSWNTFWKEIERLEKELGLRLHWSMREWGMRYVSRIPVSVKEGDVVEVAVIGRGWLRGEYLGVIVGRDLLVAISGFYRRIGDKILARIVERKDSLLIAKYLDQAT